MGGVVLACAGFVADITVLVTACRGGLAALCATDNAAVANARIDACCDSSGRPIGKYRAVKAAERRERPLYFARRLREVIDAGLGR